jgi:hypothetical protein
MKLVMGDLQLKPSQCPFHLYYRIRPCWDEKAICKLKITNSTQLENSMGTLTGFNECEFCDLERKQPCQHLLLISDIK